MDTTGKGEGDVNFEAELALMRRMDLLEDEVPQCRELRLTSVEGGRAVRTADLSAIRLNEWTDEICARFAIKIEPSGLGRWDNSPALAADAGATFQRQRGRNGRRLITPSLLRRAAETYRQHFEDRPIEAVAGAYNISTRTASLWITKARDRGYLPPTTRGKKRI